MAMKLLPAFASSSEELGIALGPVLLGLTRFVAGKMVKKLETSTPSLEELYTRICKQLVQLDSNVVVVIDDVDRLSSEEIRLIFKLVTLSASFPRVTYVLSFDKKAVVPALGDVQGIDGRRYLEKVIQLDVEMPPIKQNFIAEQINGRLGPWFERDRFYSEQRDDERLNAIYRGLVEPTITTPRQVTRYINHVVSKYFAVSDEICLIDVLGLSAVELYSPESFDLLWANRGLICKGGHSILIGERRKQRAEILKAGLSEGLPDSLYRGSAISALFPDACEPPGIVGSTPSEEEARAEGRVCCLDLFTYYCGGSYGPALSWDSAHELVASANENAVSSAFASALDEGHLVDFCRILEGHFDELPVEQAHRMIRPALLCLGKSDERFYGILGHLPADEILVRLIERVGAVVGVERLSKALVGYLPELDIDNYMGLTWLMGDELSVRNGDAADDVSFSGEKRSAVMADGAFEKLLTTYCSMAQSHTDELLRRGEPGPFAIWREAAEQTDSDTFMNFEEQITEDSRRYLLYHADLLPESFSSGRNRHCYGRGARPEDFDAARTDGALSDVMWLKGVDELAREKVAALYLLCKDAEGAYTDTGVPDWAAQNQLAIWGVSV